MKEAAENKINPDMDSHTIEKNTTHSKINNKKLIEWLLALPVDPCIQNEEGETALMLAAENPELLFVVKHLLKTCPQCLALQDKKGENALFHSVGNTPAFKELLANEQLDINHQNNEGETVLIHCCRKEHFDLIPELLSGRKDIDVNKTDKRDWTAAMYLAEKARNTEFRALNLRCCFYDYKNSKNESVLSIVIQKLYRSGVLPSREILTEYIKILFGLIIFNCDFNLPVDKDENTAIMVFMPTRDFYTLYCVLENNECYNLSVQNKYGESASSLCMKGKHQPFYFPIMLRHPTFDFKFVDFQSGNTMLMYSAIAHPQSIGDVIRHNVNTINVINKKK